MLCGMSASVIRRNSMPQRRIIFADTPRMCTAVPRSETSSVWLPRAGTTCKHCIYGSSSWGTPVMHTKHYYTLMMHHTSSRLSAWLVAKCRTVRFLFVIRLASCLPFSVPLPVLFLFSLWRFPSLDVVRWTESGAAHP